ncbi:MAG: hypothetical protein QM758_13720 [Armatimonas sp.]
MAGKAVVSQTVKTTSTTSAQATWDIDALNSLLEPQGIRVTWIGRYQDLLSGTMPIARNVRGTFRQAYVAAHPFSEAIIDKDAPIRTREQARFRVFLRSLDSNTAIHQYQAASAD